VKVEITSFTIVSLSYTICLQIHNEILGQLLPKGEKVKKEEKYERKTDLARFHRTLLTLALQTREGGIGSATVRYVHLILSHC